MKLRFTSVFTLVVLAAMLVVGCGDDAATTPIIDTTPPLAPVIEGARGDDGFVRVWWQHNTEADLRGYNVYLVGNSIQKLNRAPLEGNMFAAPTDLGGTVQVYLTALDWSGNESAPSNAKSVTIAPDDVPDVFADHKVIDAP
jgi:hypothetical protein